MEIISNNKTAVNTLEAEFKTTAAEFEDAVQAAFLRKRNNITIPGFRKGKATRKMIESTYGEGVFYEDAVNGMYQKVVSEAIEALGVEVVDMPNIEVTSVKKEEGVSFKATFTLKPEITVKEYKGLKISKSVKTVSDEDVNAEVDKMQERNARIIDVTDRAAANGDTVVFDFEGFCDDKAFEGGKAEKFSLELGSGKFIPGFEEQIVGKNIGEDFDVNVKFPEEYQAKELAGKDATFKCKIHEIKGKELPTLDDEFAKDVSEFDTLDALKADIRAKQEEAAEKESENKVDTDINEQLIANIEGEIPDAMYEHRIDDMVRDWEYRNRYQGIKIEDYLKYAGVTMEQFRENFKVPAEKQVKLRLALENIAADEKIEASAEDLAKSYEELAKEHGMDVEKIKTAIPEKSLAEDVRVENAFKFVKDNAKITKARAKKAKAEEAAE